MRNHDGQWTKWSLATLVWVVAVVAGCAGGGGGGGGTRPTRPDSGSTTDNTSDVNSGVSTSTGTGADQGSDGSLQVISAAGAAFSDFDIFEEDGQTMVEEANEAGSLIPLSPGTYVVRETANEDNVFGEIQISSNQTTTIRLGAIRTLVGGTYFILVDDEVQRRGNEPGQTVSVPAGTYTVVSPSGGGVLAEDFVVEPGITTVIE